MSTGLFHAQTPYHVITACAISLERGPEAGDHLVLSPSFGKAEALMDALEHWKACPFESMMLLRPTYDRHKYIRRFVSKTRIRHLKQFLKNNRMDEMFVFNTAGAASQALLHFSRKYHDHIETVYVEDGIAAYNSGQEVVRESKRTYQLERLFFGSWYRRVRIMGASDRIDRVMVSFPDQVREALESKPVKRIEFERLMNEKNRSWISEYIYNLSGHLLDIEYDALILITHSDNEMEERYSTMLSTAINVLQDQGLKTAIKYHPRETNYGFVDIPGSKVTILPNQPPIEAYYLLNPHRINYVVGGVSTGLVTAFRLTNAQHVISLSPIFGDKSTHLNETLAEFNINLVRDVEQIQTCLEH
jgi:hypothetical protein